MLKASVDARSGQQPHAPHPVPDCQHLLYRVEGHAGGFEGEAVQERLLQGEVGRVERLQDVRLQPLWHA